MARAIWSGSIRFGLVNIPVKLFTAVAQKELRFHQLHDKDGARIQLKRVCTADGEEVPYEHLVKGYDLGGDRHVRITPEELDALDPEATRGVDLEEFVELSSIDPIHYERTYYLAPDKGAGRPYHLLLETLRSTGRVGLGKMVLRTKQSLCAVRPLGDLLAISTMAWADEIVAPEELGVTAGKREKLPARELELAEQLVMSRSGTFEPERYKDEHREAVLALIERKAAGEELVVAPPPKAAEGKVIDLAGALEASLRAAKARGGGEPPAKGEREARPRQAARSEGRKPRAKKRGG